MLEGDLLGSHPICSNLAKAVIHPQDSLGTRLLGRGMDFIPLETLPPHVRDRLGLESTVSTRLRMRLTRAVLPRLFPLLPRRLRFYPEYLSATRNA